MPTENGFVVAAAKPVDSMNNYRKYSIADLVNIAEISFYRKLGIPIKEMRRFNTLNLTDYEKILNDAYTNFGVKINNYKIMLKKIKLKNRQISKNLYGMQIILRFMYAVSTVQTLMMMKGESLLAHPIRRIKFFGQKRKTGRLLFFLLKKL